MFLECQIQTKSEYPCGHIACLGVAIGPLAGVNGAQILYVGIHLGTLYLYLLCQLGGQCISQRHIVDSDKRTVVDASGSLGTSRTLGLDTGVQVGGVVERLVFLRLLGGLRISHASAIVIVIQIHGLEALVTHQRIERQGKAESLVVQLVSH